MDPSLALSLLHAVLNQVDYGLAVVNTDNQQLVFANPLAWQALQQDSLPGGPSKTGLVLVGDLLHTRRPTHAQTLWQALQQTRFGHRVLLKLEDSGGTAGGIAVMPLATPGFALLAFAKQHLCDTTTITLFAQERGLTSTESQVLAQVCQGLKPQQIATRQGVQLSTVRTQLRAIRLKTASDSVRELIEKVSVLPSLRAGKESGTHGTTGGMDATSALAALGLGSGLMWPQEPKKPSFA